MSGIKKNVVCNLCLRGRDDEGENAGEIKSQVDSVSERVRDWVSEWAI